tara:strand:- start:496 stop:840 length:345 start_codon:yes stop_codon:yes gene_type:complete
MKQKRSVEPGKRIEGELPEAPSTAVEIPNWWNEASSVLDRIRGEANDRIEKTNAQFNAENIKQLYEGNSDTNSFNDYYKHRLENLEDALGIDGEVMGTRNEQEMDNKFIGGGSF